MYNSFADIRTALATGDTVENITRYYLSEIEAKAHLNIFLEVFTEDALATSKLIDEKIKKGTAGRLAGMVIGLKDNLAYKGHKVSAASKILEGFESLYTASAVQRLLDEDAIIIGRLNCDEFAMGSSNENSAFGPVLNPLNEKMVPGGSSGGSAAAIAANLCTVSLGSDTGGSIRQPASFTGTVGFKPTYGRISRYGLLAYASSFDQIGPFTTTVEDAALVTEVMAGMDEYDSTALQENAENYNLSILGDKKLKIAYIVDCLEREGIDPEIKARTLELIDQLKSEGHQVNPVSFPFLDQMVPTYYVLTTAEASSNYSRYDGVHFGYQAKDVAGVENTYKKSRSEGFGEEVKRRIMLGTFVLSHGYYDAYYIKAQKVRRLISQDFMRAFQTCDVIMSPTTPSTAFKLGEKSSDPVQMYLSDTFTIAANLAGLPAMSIPCGFDQANLPIGLQLIGNYFDEAKMLATAHQYQRVTDWHFKKPPLTTA